MNLKKAKSKNKTSLSNGKLTPEHVTKMTAFWQMHHKGLDIDAIAGPKTRKSIENATLGNGSDVGKNPSNIGVFMVKCISKDEFEVSVKEPRT